jgi:hypothetical protein
VCSAGYARHIIFSMNQIGTLFRKNALFYRSKPIRGPVLRKAWIQLCRLWIRLTPLVRLVRACGILAAAWALLLYFTGAAIAAGFFKIVSCNGREKILQAGCM